MRPVTVEVVAYTPTEFFHCLHCEIVWREGGIGQKIHAEQRASALPADLADQYARIGAWAADLADRYGDRVRLNIVDAVSVEGVFKTLRYRLGTLPAIVVDGRDRCDADDLERARVLIDHRIQDRSREPGAAGDSAGGGWENSGR